MAVKLNFKLIILIVPMIISLASCSPVLGQGENTLVSEAAVSHSSGIPDGFVLLDEVKQNPYWTLWEQIENGKIRFFNAFDACIFETDVTDTCFIVEYEGQIYVDEAKMDELLFGPVMVDPMPPGYAALQEITAQSDAIASYVFFENQVSLLDAQGATIYQTLANDMDLIVCCDNVYYVKESRIQEIITASSNSDHASDPAS